MYYSYVLLTEKLLPVMCLMSSLSPSKTVRQHTEHARISVFCNGRLLHSFDHQKFRIIKIWTEIQQEVYQTKAHDLNQLMQRLV